MAGWLKSDHVDVPFLLYPSDGHLLSHLTHLFIYLIIFFVTYQTTSLLESLLYITFQHIL